MVLKDIPGDLQVAFVSTYVPRKCGIATFTHDLASAVSHHMKASLGEGDKIKIVALNDQIRYHYPDEVIFEIRDQHIIDYHEAANFLNMSPVDVVCLQHEFGIFGGEAGSNVLTMLEHLKKPVITTFHTVIQKPSQIQLETVQNIARSSSLLVVPAKKGIELLQDIYGISPEKLVFIPHGTPDVPFLDPSYYKDKFQMEGRRVILTFGLLGPNKGIENMINALKPVAEEHPEVAYIILGVTHPNVKRMHGEKYRLSLQRMIQEEGLENHVFFHNAFVSLEELIKYLVMSDILVTPYLSQDQLSSGTLAYAVACGKAVVSTPYWYAQELLGDGRGVLVPFGDIGELSEQMSDLLSNEEKRNNLRKNAYQFGRKMIWNEVGRQYFEIFCQALRDYAPGSTSAAVEVSSFSLPEVNLTHLRTLSDETGILQHAMLTTPNRRHGYATDDNARALQTCVMNWELFKEENILPLIHRYLSFLNYAFDEKQGRFRNLLTYDRRWIDEGVNEEDCHGRALHALGYTIAFPPTDHILILANQMFNEALQKCQSFTSPRALAHVSLGCRLYSRRFGGARDVRKMCKILSNRLVTSYSENSSDDWVWCEDIVTYENACIPEALIVAGDWLGNRELLDQGAKSLEWLLNIQTAKEGHLSIIGNKKWYKRGGKKSAFDQQPIEAATLIAACYNAYIITKDKKWLEEIQRSFHWFLGKNDQHEMLYDFTTGGCNDGLTSSGFNHNQGAESTLSWLSSLHLLTKLSRETPIIRRRK
ncbi:MAG: glycosyltransferase family 4 protein [Candidatus Thermoplasmatota archaeon]|nr:glycosyltransferase family 4 protein [Candidatus Thermoplasmatota archaeon]